MRELIINKKMSSDKMMQGLNENKNFSRERLASLKEAWIKLSSQVCEGVFSDGTPPVSTRNLFGREVAFSSKGGLSYVSGMSSAGLRAGAWLNSTQVRENVVPMANACRQHLPVVAMLETDKESDLHYFAGSNCFQLWAGSPQEVLDFYLIALRIAELSLIPGAVAVPGNLIENDFSSPDQNILSKFLGDPDDRIPAPSPSQQIFFGKHRRLVPNWFNTDVPVLTGSEKDVRGMAFESAANEVYFQNHLQKFIEQAFKEFSSLFGRKYESFSLVNTKNADNLIIGIGRIQETVSSAAEVFGKKTKTSFSFVRLNQVYPLPEGLSEIFKGKKAIGILEQSSDGGHPLFKEICSVFGGGNAKYYSGKFGAVPGEGAIEAFLSNMLSTSSNQKFLWLDVPFLYENSQLPKHQILLQTLAREYPDLKEKSKETEKKLSPVKVPAKIPFSIKRYKDKGPTFSRISNFYDNTTLLYESENGGLVADPFQAIPVMPPSTAGLRPEIPAGNKLPLIDPQKCTGCGSCFIYCPHSAIPAVALNIESFIKSGIQQAQANGAAISQIFPLVKSLSKIAASEINANKASIRIIRDFLPAAFEKLSQQAKFDGEKLQTVSSEVEKIVQEIGEFEIVIAENFFIERDKIEAGSGELFSLAIDINSCTGCGLCESVCNDEAIFLEEKNTELINKIENQFSTWEKFPDTSGDTIYRLIEDKRYNSLAAIMLSRNFYLSMAGPGDSEKNSPVKTMLHLALTVSESVVQPKYMAFGKSIRNQIDKISDVIKKQLNDAIPTGKMNGLADALSENLSDKISIEKIFEHWSSKEQFKALDKNALQRKVEVVKELRELDWALHEGLSGTGRSRYCLAVESSLAGLVKYPWNTFNAPAIIFDGTSTDLINGLVHGHIRHALDNLKILRRAELEANNKYDSAVHDFQIAGLSWSDLSDEEKSFVPPVILVATTSLFRKSGMAAFEDLLKTDFPVKVFVFDDAVPSSDVMSSVLSGSAGEMLPFISMKKTFVLKSSLADPEHLFSGLISGINFNGSGLFRLFAANPEKHNLPVSDWHKLTSLAVNTRAFTHLKYKPGKGSDLISSSVDLESNPDESKDWAESSIDVRNQGEEKNITYSLTWADWAYTMNEWRPHFKPYHESDGDASAIADFILLDGNAGKGKVPVIRRVDDKGEMKQYIVPEQIVGGTKACLEAWNVLNEIAGMLTEFPEKLNKKVEGELSVKYEKEIAKLNEKQKEEIMVLEQGYLEKVKQKLREKLMLLSGR